VVAGALAAVPLLGASPPDAAAGSKHRVVAAFYPVAYAAARVGGSRVDVTNLTPAGAEPHDLELTPKQIDEILDADVVFVMGHRFQPAVEKAAAERGGPTTTLLDHLPAKAGDPHVWLDPLLMQRVVRLVQQSLTRADPAGRATYARNADALVAQLQALDARYRAGLEHCARRVIVTGHEAFGYLASRYGLRQEGVSGLSPDAEPDARRIAQHADLVKRDHVTVVFTETLLSPRISDTLAREAGVRTEVLDPIEGLTDHELASGATYLTLMDHDLGQLRSALGCGA